jgi:NADPH:quinone reductase-like Zn-dependent oxidoreductase
MFDDIPLDDRSVPKLTHFERSGFQTGNVSYCPDAKQTHYNVSRWRDARPAMYAADLATLFGLPKEGRIAPIIGTRFPLEKAAEAHDLLNRRGVAGKIVLDC